MKFPLTGNVRPFHFTLFTLTIILLALILTGPSVSGSIVNVPADHATIQEAIDAAAEYDTVLVAPGTYYENLYLLAKHVLLTSNFLFDKDPQYIFNTIIDGSQPSNPDTASCIIFYFGDSNTVVQGFTITNGEGTIWPDEHGAGTYREGGGILCQYASPVIRYNRIVHNNANKIEAGVTSAGGGAIRAGDGDPRIYNNLIMYNNARYGAGIVLNYAVGTIKNNIIAFNTGGESYAGSGIWKYAGTAALVENNTIYGNESAVPGGGIYAWSSTMNLVNNIIRGNIAPSSPQIRGNVTASYNNVEGGVTGTGNIDADPEFLGNYFYLAASSPSVDAGDGSAAYDDVESSSPGVAQWPAQGSLHNDMGAYGGQGSFSFERLALFADTTVGWAPLTVNFSAGSIYDIDTWNWTFGDGGSDNIAEPSHEYTEGGYYDVMLEITSGAQNYSQTESGFIAALADTLVGDEVEGSLGAILELTLSAVTNVPLNYLVIPVEFGGVLDLKYEGFSVTGCRTENFDNIGYLHYNGTQKVLTLELNAGTAEAMAPGSGPIIKLMFSIQGADPGGQYVDILFDGYDSYLPDFVGDKAEYEPVLVNGKVSLTGCCVGQRGDANCQGGDTPDISDIVRIIDYLYLSKNPLCCPEEADATGNGGEPDVSDIVRLIDFLYLDTHTPPAACF